MELQVIVQMHHLLFGCRFISCIWITLREDLEVLLYLVIFLKSDLWMHTWNQEIQLGQYLLFCDNCRLQYASLLFVDNPIGTGFSYTNNINGFSTSKHNNVTDNLHHQPMKRLLPILFYFCKLSWPSIQFSKLLLFGYLGNYKSNKNWFRQWELWRKNDC